MKQTITLISALNADTAKSLVSQSFGAVVDARVGQGMTGSRPIEEPVLKTLLQGFVAYEQVPVALDAEEGPGLKELLVVLFSAMTPLVLVVDDAEAWRDELSFVGIKTAPLNLHSAEVILLDRVA